MVNFCVERFKLGEVAFARAGGFIRKFTYKFDGFDSGIVASVEDYRDVIFFPDQFQYFVMSPQKENDDE